MAAITNFSGGAFGASVTKDLERGKKAGQTGGAATNALLAPQAARVEAGTGSTPAAGQATQPSGTTDTYDKTGRLKTAGTTPTISDPSAGQIVGALASAVPGLGTANTVAGLGLNLANGDNPTDGYDGGALGRLLDGVRGVKPGAVTGDAGTSVASSTNARGDVLQGGGDDPRLLDRASMAASQALVGDAPTATDALFSDVALQDRRKPKSDMAGTNMLLRAAA